MAPIQNEPSPDLSVDKSGKDSDASLNDSRSAEGQGPTTAAESAPGQSQTIEKAPTPRDDDAKSQLSKTRGLVWLLAVFSLVSGVFIYSLDSTVSADVQPVIIEQLGHIEKLPWISVSGRLAATGTNLIWGKLYGMLNAKWLFIFSVALYEAGLAISASAHILDALIVGRAIAGAAGAGIYIGVLNILSARTTVSQRPLYMSFISISHCVGVLLGPVVGGGFAKSKAGWRWAFYFNICMAAALAPAYFFAVPSVSFASSNSLAKRVKSFDYLGALLSIGGLSAFVLAITFGGIVWPFSSGNFIGSLVGGIVLLILFALQQCTCLLTSVPTRLFAVELLHDYEMWNFYAQTAAVTAPTFIPIFFIPLYFQFVRNDDALEAGVRLLPFVAVAGVVNLANGTFMARTGYYWIWYLVGSTFIIVGSALMRLVTVTSPDSVVYGYSVVLAAGVGACTQASFAAAQTRVKPEKIPRLLSFLGISQMLGMALVFATSYSIFFNKATARVGRILVGAPTASVQSAIAGTGGGFFALLDEERRGLVLDAIVASMSDVYDMILASGVLCLLLALAMRKDRAFKRIT